MRRPLAFGLGAASPWLLAAAGCSTTSAGEVAADDAATAAHSASDAATGPDGQGPIDAAQCTDANAMIQASSFDQTCQTNEDCITIGEGNVCNVCSLACPTATINVGARAQYLAAFANTPAGGATAGVVCACPTFSSPCCLGGQCRLGIQCVALPSTGDAAMGPGANAATDGGGADALAE
jgi:hypothetical protein